MKWTYCPECGNTELHHAEGMHKQCVCGQEWFSDIDYTDVVRGHLAKIAPLLAVMPLAAIGLKSEVARYDAMHQPRDYSIAAEIGKERVRGIYNAAAAALKVSP